SAEADVRLAAIRRLSDRAALLSLAEAAGPRAAGGARLQPAGSEGVRRAALEPLSRLDGQPGGPRHTRLREMPLDPAPARPGQPRLALDFRIATDEKRYVRDDSGALVKGKVLVEAVTVTVRRGGELLFRKVYRGNKARRGEVFGAGAPVEGGYRVKFNPAEVD